MPRRKQIEIEEEPEGVSPISAVVWSAAAVAGLLVVYNIFFGQPPDAARMARQSLEPAGQSIKSNQNTIVLRYDPMLEELQRELLASGHYRGLVDGVHGVRTKEAIAAYQRDNNLTGAPEASQALLDHIRFTRKVSDAAEFTASTEQPATKPKDARLARLQQALAEMGYEPGDATGELNAETRAAIRKFEQQNGLPVDGKPDSNLLTELARVTGRGDLE
jgi:peptidoglycan hydrolase-like protein with peptidoglycan-binding domain